MMDDSMLMHFRGWSGGTRSSTGLPLGRFTEAYTSYSQLYPRSAARGTVCSRAGEQRWALSSVGGCKGGWSGEYL